MVIKANTPADFAEKYIVESIWKGRFSPGSVLPSERELSELIGITRTTLREVLQRLARDGWLTIRHGKPTKVNRFMETSGLNILDTLMTLDSDNAKTIAEGLLEARSKISLIFMRCAFKGNSEKSRKAIVCVIESCESLLAAKSWDDFIGNLPHPVEVLKGIKDSYYKEHSKQRETSLIAMAFNHYDYMLFQRLAFYSGNQIYGLIFNGLKKLCGRVGSYYFSNPDARGLALSFYKRLLIICMNSKREDLKAAVYQYGRESVLLWQKMNPEFPAQFIE